MRHSKQIKKTTEQKQMNFLEKTNKQYLKLKITGWIKSRTDMAEERDSKIEDRTIQIIQQKSTGWKTKWIEH